MTRNELIIEIEKKLTSIDKNLLDAILLVKKFEEENGSEQTKSIIDNYPSFDRNLDGSMIQIANIKEMLGDKNQVKKVRKVLGYNN